MVVVVEEAVVFGGGTGREGKRVSRDGKGACWLAWRDDALGGGTVVGLRVVGCSEGVLVCLCVVGVSVLSSVCVCGRG